MKATLRTGRPGHDEIERSRRRRFSPSRPNRYLLLLSSSRRETSGKEKRRNFHARWPNRQDASASGMCLRVLSVNHPEGGRENFRES